MNCNFGSFANIVGYIMWDIARNGTLLGEKKNPVPPNNADVQHKVCDDNEQEVMQTASFII